MIDFHSHILPGIDDGADSIETSLEMLRIAHAQGVKTVVATPHCYLDRTSPEEFISARDRSEKLLAEAINKTGEQLPEVIPGAELYWSSRMSSLEQLDRLCIAGTKYILIEMPYSDWKDEVFEELYHLTKMGYKPIIAHLDRFFSKEKQFGDLLSLDVLCQINADAFFDSSSRKKVMRLFSQDAAHLIGSDMHNLTSRPPNLTKAYGIISTKFGAAYSEFFTLNAHLVISGKNVPPTQLPSLDLLKRLML